MRYYLNKEKQIVNEKLIVVDEYNIKTNYNKANNISVRNVTKNQADYTLNIELSSNYDNY